MATLAVTVTAPFSNRASAKAEVQRHLQHLFRESAQSCPIVWRGICCMWPHSPHGCCMLEGFQGHIKNTEGHLSSLTCCWGCDYKHSNGLNVGMTWSGSELFGKRPPLTVYKTEWIERYIRYMIRDQTRKCMAFFSLNSAFCDVGDRMTPAISLNFSRSTDFCQILKCKLLI